MPEEVVLNDVAGLHLSAGPYFLIYSAALTEEEENMPMPWPEDLKACITYKYTYACVLIFVPPQNSVKYNNMNFLSALPEEIRASVVDPNSPPTAPYDPPSPSDEDISTLDSEPLSRPDRMEID